MGSSVQKGRSMVGVVTRCAILSSSVLDKMILNEMVYSHLCLYMIYRDQRQIIVKRYIRSV